MCNTGKPIGQHRHSFEFARHDMWVEMTIDRPECKGDWSVTCTIDELIKLLHDRDRYYYYNINEGAPYSPLSIERQMHQSAQQT